MKNRISILLRTLSLCLAFVSCTQPKPEEKKTCETPSFGLAKDTTLLFKAHDGKSTVKDSVHYEITFCEDSTGIIEDTWASRTRRGVYDVMAYAYRDGWENSEKIYGRCVDIVSPSDEDMKQIVVFDNENTINILGLADSTLVTFYDSSMYYIGETYSKNLRAKYTLPEREKYIYIETGYSRFVYPFDKRRLKEGDYSVTF